MIYRHIYSNVIYPLYHWSVKDGANAAIKELDSNAALDRLSLEALTSAKLVRLLEFARANVPFYRARFAEAEIGGNEKLTAESIVQLPLLSKECINLNNDVMISEDLSNNGLDKNSTGGSTGEVLRFYTDWKSGSYRKATVRRNKRWLGIYPGDREVRLWGAPLDIGRYKSVRGKIHAAITQERYLSADRLDEKTLSSYLQFCESYKPKLLIAYPSALMEFADHCGGRGKKIDSLKAIICSAETLFDHERKRIENVFGTKIYNRYGCREVGDIAHEVPGEKGLLVNSDRIFVEILDPSGRPCAPGEQGEVVVTDLDNYGMPLIRYRIGDFARWADPAESIQSTHPFPRLASVDGRTLDVVRSPTGERVGGTYWTLLLRSRPGFKKMQVIQKDIDLVQILYVQEPGFAPDFNYFRKEIAKKCGAELNVEFIETDRFVHEPGSKFRLVISQF